MRDEFLNGGAAWLYRDVATPRTEGSSDEYYIQVIGVEGICEIEFWAVFNSKGMLCEIHYDLEESRVYIHKAGGIVVTVH